VGSNPIKGSRCFFEQEKYPHCLELVGFGNDSEHEFTIKLKLELSLNVINTPAILL